MNIYNQKGEISEDDIIYQSFNIFIFSNDRKVFHKLIYRVKLFEMVKDLPGDIVECGVFKGSGIFTWSKLIELNCQFEIKKVVGFDYFERDFVKNLSEHDRRTMGQVFSRCDVVDNEISIESITSKFENIGIPNHKFDLIKGDVSFTTRKYVEDNPGFRISLLYMDLDLEKPTTDTLNNLWDIVVPGGIVVFDEYGYGVWTESKAVDDFVSQHNLKLHKTNVSAPTAYVVKPSI